MHHPPTKKGRTRILGVNSVTESGGLKEISLVTFNVPMLVVLPVRMHSETHSFILVMALS